MTFDPPKKILDDMHPTFLGCEARQEVHRGSGTQRSMDD